MGCVLALVLAAFATTGFASLPGAAAWARSAPTRVLLALGGRRDPFTGAVAVPGVRTLARVLAAVDPAALQAAADAFTTTLHLTPLAGLAAVAVDGKTVRGARRGGARPAHLVAVVTHATNELGPVVLTWRVTGAKSGEAPVARDLLAQMDLGDTVVTFDAGHTNAATATAVLAAGGHYLLVIKGNQPTLLDAAAAALSGSTDTGHVGRKGIHDEYSRGHGRIERRTLTATTTPPGAAFPGGVQMARIVRRRKPTGARTWDSKQIIHLITSLPPELATPAVIAGLARGHWGIEALHHVRDIAFAEDASTVSTGHAPVHLAALRNLVTTPIRTAGRAITAVRRWAGAKHHHALRLLTGRATSDIKRL